MGRICLKMCLQVLWASHNLLHILQASMWDHLATGFSFVLLFPTICPLSIMALLAKECGK